jgi:hypothetical protein
VTAADVAWGEPGDDGIAIGLKVARGADAFAYQIAIANRSNESRKVTLFDTGDPTFLTRLVARQHDVEEVRAAVKPAVPVTSRYKIEIELGPGAIAVQDGAAAAFGLKGEVILHAVLGGTDQHPAAVRSGEVSASI